MNLYGKYDNVMERIRRDIGFGGDTMNVEEMKQRKKELGYSNEKLSELSGVPLGTVQKVLAGVTKSPRYETLTALEKALKKQTDRIGEILPEISEKRQGDYTIEDYYLMPEERRVELIDGVIYDMASPTAVHQILSTELCNIIRSYISKQKGRCIVMAAPMDVQLDCNDKTMVQPDVMVVCDRDKITRKCVYGAPDLVVEILSDSTKKKDMYVKLGKYMEAGVREYWLVDPNGKKVVVYNFEAEVTPVIYGFGSKVPVSIWGGECKVDFAEIYEYISFLYEEDDL